MMMMMMLSSRLQEFSWILDIVHAHAYNGSRESSCNLNMHLLPHQLLALRLMDSRSNTPLMKFFILPPLLYARCECGFAFSVDLVT